MHYDISGALRRFIGENFVFQEDLQSLPDDASFLENNIIDSTGVLELVCFLENTFGIEVADEEMLPENLDSIRAVTTYVTRKIQPRQAQLAAA
ncbi:MAG TPA: acyl carrier protein [Burkholderiales bacterium]|nr:acyl carrier protein [Burkholderiales bacterium]